MKVFFLRNRWLIISICGVAVIAVVIVVLLTTQSPPPQPTVSPTTTPTTTIPPTTTSPPTSPPTPPAKFTHPAIGVPIAHASPDTVSGCAVCHNQPITFDSCMDCHNAPDAAIGTSVSFPHHSMSWGSSREYCRGCHQGADADARFVTVPVAEHPFCGDCHQLRH